MLADVLDRPLIWFFHAADPVDEVAITSSLVGSLSEVQALIAGEWEFDVRVLKIKAGKRISSRAKVPQDDMIRRLRDLAGGLDESQLTALARQTRSEAELRAARTLGITPAEMSVAAHGLWGRPLIEERELWLSETEEAEAPLRSLRGYRGHITRKLIRDLRSFLLENGTIDSGFRTTHE